MYFIIYSFQLVTVCFGSCLVNFVFLFLLVLLVHVTLVYERLLFKPAFLPQPQFSLFVGKREANRLVDTH